MSKSAASQRSAQSGKANRWLLYGPLAIGAVLFAGYYFAWNYGAGIMRTEVDRFIGEQRSAGMIAEHGEVEIEGFPFLLRADIPQPVYADPAAGWRWEAGALSVDTLPLNPTRLILSPAGTQYVTTQQAGRTTKWLIEAEMTKASLSETETGLELRGLTATPVEGQSALPLTSLKIGLLRNNTRLTDNADTGIANDIGSLGFEAQKVAVTLPDNQQLTITYFDTSLTGTALEALQSPSTGETSLESWRREGGTLMIEDMRLIVDDETALPPTQLRASGTLFIDPQDYLAGQLSLAVKDHKALMSVLSDAGLLPEQIRENLLPMLDNMAEAVNGEMKVNLSLRNGGLYFGPVRVGNMQKIQ